MASRDDKKESARRGKKRPGEEDEEAAPVAVVAPAYPAWLRVLVGFVVIVLLSATAAFGGAWMGVRSVESQLNYGPQELEEEDEDASLPPLTLIRGLDIAMERALPKGEQGGRLLAGSVNWPRGRRITESAVLSPLEPDRAREVERPMVPRSLGDTRVDRDALIVSESLEAYGRLGRAEPLNHPVPRPRSPAATGETVVGIPGTPRVRPLEGQPADAQPVSTIAPPSVYNDAVGEPGRRHPLPYEAEHALPSPQPPEDGSPIESMDASSWRSRGLMP